VSHWNSIDHYSCVHILPFIEQCLISSGLGGHTLPIKHLVCKENNIEIKKLVNPNKATI
jgi:hypothetical protein